MKFQCNEIPDLLEFRIGRDRYSAAGVLVKVILKTVTKNDYSQIYGPSNESGYISITKDDILRSAKKDADFFPADYNPLTGVFAGSYSVDVMQEISIQKALKAYALFSKSYEYPSGYEQMLNAALSRSEELDLAKLSVVPLHRGAEGGRGSEEINP